MVKDLNTIVTKGFQTCNYRSVLFLEGPKSLVVKEPNTVTVDCNDKSLKHSCNKYLHLTDGSDTCNGGPPVVMTDGPSSVVTKGFPSLHGDAPEYWSQISLPKLLQRFVHLRF